MNHILKLDKLDEVIKNPKKMNNMKNDLTGVVAYICLCVCITQCVIHMCSATSSAVHCEV